MVKFDDGLMYCAISKGGEYHGFPVDTGFIHRTTGKIVFVCEDEGRSADFVGMDTAVDMIFDRARVEANPGQWIEIPKYNGPDGGEDAFIAEFLKENGLS